MNRALPPLLAAMIAAQNAHNADAFLACLADEAVVRDEGHTHVGTAAIRAWFETTTRKYTPHVEVTSLSTIDGEPVINGSVSGNFEGSPVALRYFVGVEDGKIVALKIVPQPPPSASGNLAED